MTPTRCRAALAPLLLLATLLPAPPAQASLVDEHRVEAAPGVVLRVRDLGAGRPVLLLTGGPGFAGDTTLDLARHVAGDQRAILPDQRGTGASRVDLDAVPFDLDGAVADLEAIRSALGLERWTVVGHSYGGILAMSYAARHPQVVEALGLIGPGGLSPEFFSAYQRNLTGRLSAEALQELGALRPASAAPDDLAASIRQSNRLMAPAMVEVPTALPRLLEFMGPEHFEPRVTLALQPALMTLDLREAVAAYDGPVVVLQGEHDPIGRPVAEQIVAAFPRARLAVLPGSAHWPELETPETLFAAIDRFLAETEDGAARDAEAAPGAGRPGPGSEDESTDAATAPRWQTLETEPYRGKQDDLVFVTPDRGWYANGSGKLYTTEDGGDTWRLQHERPGTFFRALGFVDEQVGLIGNVGVDYFPGVTDETLLYRTTDGGESWTPVALPEGAVARGGICAIQVLREPFINHGVLDEHVRLIAAGRVGGPAQLLISDDLGATWTASDLRDVGAMILDVHFFDRRHGLLASATDTDVTNSHALVLRTEDGGATWRPVYRSPRPFEITWKFSFPTDETGFVTIQSYDPDPAASARFVARTDDGGRSWRELPLVDDASVRTFGIGFLDERTGWVGAMPHGFVTTDGGASWSVAEDLGRAVNKVRFLRDEDGGVHGWAIGVQVHRLEP